MKKHLIIISLAVTATSALSQLLFSNLIPQWGNYILLLLIFTLSIFVLLMQNPIQNLLKLSNITNNIPKNTTRISTVPKFLQESKEEKLNKGDYVKILTNNLCNYDLLDENVDILSKNLSEGVQYEYYLPIETEPELQENLEELVRKISQKTSMELFFNLKVFKTNNLLLFSYAIVKSENSNVKCYWYIATSSKNKSLTIVSIEGESKHELLHVFAKLSGKEINIVEMARSLNV